MLALHVFLLILYIYKYHPQVYLEQCKYKVMKKELKNFIDYEVDLDSDYESDLSD